MVERRKNILPFLLCLFGLYLFSQNSLYVYPKLVSTIAFCLLIFGLMVWLKMKFSGVKLIMGYSQTVVSKFRLDICYYIISIFFFLCASVMIFMPVIESTYFKSSYWGKMPFLLIFFAAAVGYMQKGIKKGAVLTQPDQRYIKTPEKPDNKLNTSKKLDWRYGLNITLLFIFLGLLIYAFNYIERTAPELFEKPQGHSILSLLYAYGFSFRELFYLIILCCLVIFYRALSSH